MKKKYKIIYRGHLGDFIIPREQTVYASNRQEAEKLALFLTEVIEGTLQITEI